METMEIFWNECGKVGETLLETDDDRAAEPHLVKILTIVKQSPQQREIFVKAFLEILENPDKWSGLVLEFCMHDLRYPEVQRRCLEMVKNHKSPYGLGLPKRVLDACQDNWWERQVFDYFSRKQG